MLENPQMKRARLKKMFKYMFFFSLISLLVLVALLSCVTRSGYSDSIDLDAVHMLQLDEIKEGAPTAVIHTTEGDISVVLYPNEAPNAVERFTRLAKSGYYDGTYVYRVETDVFFAAGAGDSDGNLPAKSAESDESVERELSANLWPLRGALCAPNTHSDTGALKHMFGNPKTYNGSKFVLLDTIQFTDEILSELMKDNEENPVAKAFRDVGGVPNFSRQMTVFGQTYDGFETIDAITAAALTPGTDGNKPAKDIQILSIDLGTYSSAQEQE